MIDSASGLLQELHKHELLPGAQLEEVNRRIRPSCTDSRALARELLQRGWLTAFQANYLLGGRGSALHFGPYLLLDRLGEGATGQVFKARHTRMQRTVAVKVLRPELLTDTEVVQRFFREVQVISGLTSPYIVHAYDAGQIGAMYYLVMEFIEGSDLAQLVKQNGPLGILQACSYIQQAALGLQHAHEQGLVHRDIKPSNLLVSRQAAGNSTAGPVTAWGLIKLLDLGLARAPRLRSEEAALTMAGKGMMGTPDYLAPEQALDFHKADIRADLYSLGCTFFFLLTGQPPFPTGTLAQKLMKHQQAEPPALDKLRPDAPPPLLPVVRRLLAKNPDDRYQTPAELAGALGAFLDASPRAIQAGHDRTLLATSGSTARLPVAVLAGRSPAARRRRWLWFNGAAALILIGLSTLFIVLLTRSSSTPTPSATGNPLAVVEEPAALALKPLYARYMRYTQHGTEESEPLRRELIAFQKEYPGTAPGLRAAQLLRDLPSPLDRLSEQSIPAEQRHAWQPKELVAVLGEHRGRGWNEMTSLAVSPDGRSIAGGCPDGNIYIFDAETLQPRHALKDRGAHISGLAFADDQTLGSCGQDYTVNVWRLAATPKMGKPLTHPAAYVNGLAFAPGGKLLAAANADSAIHIWEQTADAWKEKTPLKGHSDWVHRVLFSADGKTLASSGGDGTIRLWDVGAADITLRSTLKGHTGAIAALCLAADGRLLISGGHDKTLRIWDATNPDKAPLIHKEEYRIQAVALSADTKWLASATASNGQVSLWSLADPHMPRRLVVAKGFGSEAHAVAFLPNNKGLVISGSDRKLRLLEISATAIRERVVAPGGDVGVGGMTGLAAGPDGQTLAVHGRYDSTVQLWTLADAAPRERLRLPNYGSVPSPMAFAPDGQAFINATYGPVSYCALTADKPHPVNLQPPHTARPVALAFAPDGKTFASAGSTDQTVRLWDATRPEPKERGVIKFKDPGLQALALAFTADARTLAVLASDRKVHLWDVEGATPEPRGTPLADLSTSPAGIGFSPDGKVLVVIGDGRAALYDWAGPRPSLRTAFGGAQGNGTNIVITSLAFSPDGKQVAVSATGPEAVLLYDAVSGKRLRSWTLLGLVHAVDFGADSRHLFVANGNGTVYVLRLARPVAAGK